MKKEKKRTPCEVLQPGERNDFWETILRIRDIDDSRWNEFSPGLKYSASMYEQNHDAVKGSRAAA